MQVLAAAVDAAASYATGPDGAQLLGCPVSGNSVAVPRYRYVRPALVTNPEWFELLGLRHTT